MLNTEGRVVLKIYDKLGNLLVARPCLGREEAEDRWDKRKKADGETYSITAMVPRI